MIKNNSNCPLEIAEYNAHEKYWGSDHRPVYAQVSLVTQPQYFIDPLTLLNAQNKTQGHGEIVLLHTMMEMYQDRFLPLAQEKYRFPLFFSLQFRADWLLSSSVTG